MPTIRESTLIKASEDGDKGLVEDCLNDAGVNINAKGDNNMTALHHAAIKGHIDIMKILVTRRAKINIKNAGGDTSLHLAVRGNQKAVVQFLLENGADYRLKNDYKEVLLIDTVGHQFGYQDAFNKNGSMTYENFFYIKKGHTPFKKPPVEQSEFNNYHYYKDYNSNEIDIQKGLTPLELAQKEDKGEIVELILDFISKQKYSIIEATSKIETSANQISRLEQEIQELKQITLQNRQLTQQNINKTLGIFKFFPDVQPKHLVSAAFVLSIAIFLYEEEVFKPYKLVPLLVLALVAGYIVNQLEQEWNNAKRELNEAKQQLARIKNQFSEILVEGVALIKTTRTTVQVIGATSMTVGNAVEALQATTDVVLLEFKDQMTGLVYELKGVGRQVAEAFDYGVRNNKFRPEANVNVNAHVEARLEGSLFNVFKF